MLRAARTAGQEVALPVIEVQHQQRSRSFAETHTWQVQQQQTGSERPGFEKEESAQLKLAL